VSRPNLKRMGAALAALTLPLAATACGGASESAESGTPQIRVTTIGYPNEITLVWGVEKGVFEEHGLDVEMVPIQSGSAALAATISGHVELAFTGGWAAIQSAAQGLDVKIAVGAYTNTVPVDPKTGRGTFVSNDAGIEEICDLEGKTFATNELNGPSQTYQSVAMTQAGCDPTLVQWIAMPASQLSTALESGTVDAINAPASTGQPLVAQGLATWLMEPIAEVQGAIPYGAYSASPEWIDGHEDDLELFVEAYQAALDEVLDPANHDAVLAMEAEFGHTTVEALEATQFETLTTSVDREALQTMADIMFENGVIAEEVDTSKLVWDGAPE
jgi:NitT/TauT family transport system substrate-binding protein